MRRASIFTQSISHPPTHRTDRLAPDWVDPRIDAKAEMERHLKEKAAKAAPKKQKTAAE